MADLTQKFEVPIKNGINTDTIGYDFYNFGDQTIPMLENTGIERDGGVTNIYKSETAYSETADHCITDSGKDISLVESSGNKIVKIDGKAVGEVSSYGVEKNISISDVEDIALTSTGYITCSINGGTITVAEYDLDKNLLNTKSTVFINLANVMKYYTSLSFVKYNGIKFSDSLEFSLRLGDQVVILQESNPNIDMASAVQSADILGGNAITCSVLYKNTVVFAGVGGRVGSWDGLNWKKYDGSGAGLGTYNNATAIGNNTINCMLVYSYGGIDYLIVAGAGGRLASFNGVSWSSYTSGSAVSNNATVVSTDDITALYQYREFLIVGSALGKLGSWSGRTASWTLYSGSGVCDNATLIGAVSINAITAYNDVDGYDTIVVAGASGRIGSFKINGSINWTQTTMPASLYWQSVAYGNGKFVAVGGSSIAAYSYDGITWIQTSMPASLFWHSVAYGNGKFVAVGGSSIAAYSYDGITWIQTSMPVASGWQSVAYGNGKFVAVSTYDTNISAYSYDGITWTQAALPSTAKWYSVVYGNGKFVAVSGSNISVYSYDGITWIQTTLPVSAQWYSVAYGNGKFVAIVYNSNVEAYSYDGITWIQTTLPVTSNWISVTYGNCKFVAISTTYSNISAYSYDGITWTQAALPSTARWQSVAYGNGKFVAIVYNSNVAAYSTDTLATKSPYTSTSTPQYPTANGAINGGSINIATIKDKQLVCAGAAGLVYQYDRYSGSAIGYNVIKPAPIERTTSFVKLSESNSPLNAAHIAYGNGKYVGVTPANTTNTAIYSTNRETWTTVTMPSTQVWRRIVYGGNKFVAIAYNSNVVAYSYDGITWTQSAMPVASNWISLTYGGGKFVAISATNSNIAAYSADGINWTQASLPASAQWYSVAYGLGKFVAIAMNSNIAAYSIDGITWTQSTMPASQTWGNIVAGSDKFVAMVDNSTSAAYSTDGINWTSETLPAAFFGANSLAYVNGMYLALTGTYTINGTSSSIYSTDGISWTALTLPYLNTTVSADDKNYFILSGGYYTISNVLLAQPYTDNQTILGTSDIKEALITSDNYLVFGGTSGRIGSFTSSNVKNSYASGQRYTNNSVVVYTSTITGLSELNNLILVSASNIANSMSPSGASNPFYTDGTNFVTSLMGGMDVGYLYTYRYENGIYLYNLVGNTLGISYVLNTSNNFITIINARYVMPQVSNGFTRHIISTTDLSTRHVYSASQIKNIGLLGYTDFTTFSQIAVYPDAPWTLGNGYVLKSQAGFGGYAEMTFQTTASTTGVLSYFPQWQTTPTALYQVIPSNANLLLNVYGKLSNNYGLATTKPFEFRVNWINGVQSYLSCAVVDSSATDALGTIITGIGEFDDTYQPDVYADDTILYKYNNNFYITKIGTAADEKIQRIAPDIYKINTISPFNIVSTIDNGMKIGSVDYNGRMIFNSSSDPTTSTKVAAVITGEFSNSVDVGDKLVTIAAPNKNNIECVGIRIPNASTYIEDYAVDVYVSDVYSFSALNGGIETSFPAKQDTVYVSTTNVPIPIGINYTTDGTALGDNKTLLLKPDYDGYSVGNDIAGLWSRFILFGQDYLFDGKNIYQANIDAITGVFSTKTLVASAIGLTFIAVSPSEAYFYSGFDNSVYTFNGGRTLSKLKRMNHLPIITDGIYNVRENTLVFNTADRYIWNRDGVLTESYKSNAQIGAKLYSTADGIIIGNNQYKWNYSYYNNGGTPDTLVLQTPYYGFNLNEKSILSSWVITIFNDQRTPVTVKATCYVIDEDTSREQIVNWVVNPMDYTPEGYARLRVQPANQRSLGTSIKLETSDKILIMAVLPEFVKAETTVVAAARSR